MNYQEIVNIYFKDDYIRKIARDESLDKEDLLQLLKCWKMITTKHTLGDLSKYSAGLTKLIFVTIGANTYYITADTTREGVIQFLLNKDNKMKTIANESGRINKITNCNSNLAIPGFYMYKEI